MIRKLLKMSAIGSILASSFLLVLAQENFCRRLDAEAAKRFLPDRVPLETEVIPVDAKVVAALQFPNKARLVIAALATGSFSREVREKYQYILISETRIKLDRWTIPSGIVGLALEPQSDDAAPTRSLISRDFSGSEIDRLAMRLDAGSASVPLSLTPKSANEFELRIGKYVIAGAQK